MGLFERGTKQKVRFNYKGLCTIEDLWDLSETILDGMFKKLNAIKKTQSEESLLETKTKENTLLNLKIDIIKHIVAVKIKERKDKEARVEKAERKQKILNILAEKQDESLKGKSEAELMEELEKL